MTRITNIPNLEGYGVFVDDINFKNLSRQEWMDLGKLSMQKLVMIIRSTGLDSRSFHQVIKKWGKDRQNYAATLFAKYPWANGQVDQIIASTEVSEEEKKTGDFCIDVTLIPWIILSADKKVIIPVDVVTTIVEPINSVKQMFIDKNEAFNIKEEEND